MDSERSSKPTGASRLIATWSQSRSIWVSWIVPFVGLTVAGMFVSAASEIQKPEAAETDRIGLRMVLDEGEIVIALDRAAAPDTIRTILELAEPEPQPDGEARGYYDGLALDYTWPHIELGTGVRSGDAVLIPQEIDAVSLGLDSEKITDGKTAMNLWQFEFAKANNRWKTEGHRPERFEEWLGIFNETSSVDFLMDVPIEEINEVLGYRYVTGLESLRARKGFVYLKPVSIVDNSPALRILLTDRPQLDGRVTVVGRVVKGLDLAQQLSVCELKTFRNREIREPVDPVVIRRMEVIELPGTIPTSLAPDGDRGSTVHLDDGRSTGASGAAGQPAEEVEPGGGSR